MLSAKRVLRYVLILAITGYILWSVVDGLRESWRWAYPGRTQPSGSPADVGLGYEAVAFKTRDGLTLRGWFMPGTNDAGILLIHTFGSNRSGVLPVAAALVRHGYSVLAFDARAHGESDGTLFAHVERDGIAAAEYLKTRPEVRPDRIGAWGVSIGGMMALQAAAASDSIKAVAADGAAVTTWRDFFPPVDVARLVLSLDNFVFAESLRLRAGEFAPRSTLEAVAKIAPRPVFLIAAGGSSFERETAEVRYAAAGEPKSLWIVPGVGHTGGWDAYPEEYTRRLVAFFDRSLTP